MNTDYADIIVRAGEPMWWDEHAVPRYCVFGPGVQSVYAKEAVLFKIACQDCRRVFLVGMTFDNMDLVYDPRAETLAEQIRAGSLHYGDPPYHKCRGAGDTESCDDLRVVEYWHRAAREDWRRDAALKVDLAALGEKEGER